MAIAKKVLKEVGEVLTKPNTIQNGGGLSSLIVRRRVTAAGGLTAVGVVGAATLANEGFKGHNRAKLGRIAYGGGPARMTKSFTSGAVEAMHRASNGNYAAFSDMAEEVVTNQTLGGVIENYGATPELISALYNMGGR